MTLELHPRAGRVVGRISTPGEEDREFSGYLELVSLIEEVRSATRVTTSIDGGEEQLQGATTHTINPIGGK